jgi:hypothetical protein
MSRTYRRKKDNGYNYFEAYDYVWVNGIYLKQYYSKGSVEYKKEKAKFHSDRQMYGGGVPSWFVNLFCERAHRGQTKREIQRWMNNPENYEAMVPEFIRDAGWKYW